jgi:aspartate carbamoyltransferase catalytic subunit
MYPDVIVLRHKSPGACHFLARTLKAAIVNAGDGAHEHPTQALLDALTIREKKGGLEGLKIVIVGDIAHSRVFRSDLHLFQKLGARVVVVGPPGAMPVDVEKFGVQVTHDFSEGLEGADVVMMLRVQFERQEALYFPSVREYFRFFGLTRERLKGAKKDVIIMHPGPMNRGVEIASDVADGPYSVILEQVANGVAVRMAVLYLLSGGVFEGAAD